MTKTKNNIKTNKQIKLDHTDNTLIKHKRTPSVLTEVIIQKNKFPLTLHQKDIWFDQKIHENEPLYNIGGYMDIKGSFDIGLFQTAINHLILNNDALRLIFFEEEGIPYQKVSPNSLYTVPIIDFSKDKNPRQKAKQFMHHEFIKPFKLVNNFLFQFTLIKISQNQHYAIGKYHHLICDGWAGGLINQRIILLYNQLKNKKTDGLANTSYIDFINNDKKYVESNKYNDDKKYWSELLSEKPENLFLIKQKRNLDALGSKRKTIYMKNSDYNRVTKFASKNKLTNYQVLLGVLFLYLSRVNKKEDICIGTPVLNRHNALFKQTVGLFTGVIPIRKKISQTQTFFSLVLEIKELLMQSYRHQRYPLSSIYKDLHIQYGERLFDVVLSFDPSSSKDSFDDCTTKATWLSNNTSSYPLLLSVRENSRKNYVEFVFDFLPQIFNGTSSMDQMISHFFNILDQVVKKPGESLCTYQINTDEEQKIINNFNKTYKKYPINQNILIFFENQVESNPNNTALVYNNQSLSYEELNKKANSLAQLLRKKGIKRNSVVGILAERSFELVIGIYAIIKAGGAYLPIDPDYPVDRITYMIKNSGINILLTQTHLTKDLKFEGELINLNKADNYISIAKNHQNSIKASDPAYVIYTSGSTGQPKGVINTHAGLFNRLYWMQEEYKLNKKDKVLQKTPFSFDVSVWEFFWPLMFGAQLVLAKPAGHKNSKYIKDLIYNQRITVTHFVPSMLQVFLNEKGVSICSSLRHVICSGEELSYITRNKFYKLLKANLHNLYGPTEAAIDVTYWQCKRNSRSNIVPIGRPIANMQIYVLDDFFQPVPIGYSGEIYIGGIGVAIGYINNQSLTEERFIHNPFSKNNEKMYKTGDLGRWLSDGTIEYLGRIDDQIKIRGLRIELGEIKNTLLMDGNIKQAVVNTKNNIDGSKEIVAYITLKNKTLTNIDSIQHFLKQKLPDYMIPSTINVLESIPLLPNGKVNYQKIRQQNAISEKIIDDKTQKKFSELSLEEKILCDIFSENLDLIKIKSTDDFFAMGGDSLRAVLVIQMAEKYNIKFTVKELYLLRTPEKIANKIAKTPVKNKINTKPKNLFIEMNKKLITNIVQNNNYLENILEDCYPISQMQLFMLKNYNNKSGAFHFQQTINFRSINFDVSLFEKAIQYTINKYPILRTVFLFSDKSEFVQVVLKNQKAEFYYIDCKIYDGNDSSKILFEDQKNTFITNNPEKPLIRFYLIQKTNNEYAFIMSAHHAVYDGWSNICLLTELLETYVTLNHNQQINSTVITNDYKRFVEQEINNLSSDDFTKYINKHSNFKNNRSQINNGKDYYKSIEKHINEQLYKDIQQLGKELSVSSKEIFLSAYYDLVSFITKEKTNNIGIISNGRNNSLSNPATAIGLFWRILPLTVSVESNKKKQINEVNKEISFINGSHSDEYLNKNIYEELFSTFNFINFHNVKQLLSHNALEVTSYEYQDIYSFPLNLKIYIDPLNKNLPVIEFVYNLRYFDDNKINEYMGHYLNYINNYTKQI
ncbi:MAG: hypothetical protein A2Y40_09545 [Candidatus Margulisbacteria bacterium GWF2_35_9]|nr:MAG: hypothetical protein A2Y40_09545 [Candidatus Margulisbacteria bacterium GWF2_35_9]